MPSKYSKYNNKKVCLDGQEFDSRKEAKRYAELQLLLRAGEIKDLDRQVRIELIPAQYVDDPTKPKGKRCVELAVNYVADFVYTDTRTGEKVIEDTKGFKTKDYIIKRKLARYIKGIAIKEV